MNAHEELVLRCAARRRAKIGPLSDRAYEELVAAVRERPEAFVDDPAEEAFAELARGLDAYAASLHDDDLLDDEEYQRARTQRLAALRRACDRALAIDDGCLDARLLDALAADLDPDPLTERLLDLEGEFGELGLGELGAPAGGEKGGDAVAAAGAAAAANAGPAAAASPAPDPASGGLWDDVFARPRLRLRAALSRTYLDGARMAKARDAAASLVAATPSDPLGARHTQALALARLEDEEGFDALDARFGRRGTTWTHLARVLLLYKLDRMPAARRALRGFDDLCEGGAYALLRPTYVEIYLPDRPEVAPGSFEESMLATREAEPIVADVPDFVAWCQDQDWFATSAVTFAERNDLDW